VIPVVDSDTIYRVPLLLRQQKLDDIVCEKFKLNQPFADLSEWEKVLLAMANPTASVNIAIVGKYTGLTDSYKSLTEALTHASIATHTQVKITYIDSEHIEIAGTDCLSSMNGILVPGGFGERGVEGKIKTVRFAREQNIPFLGICLGMQVAVVEFARHVAGLTGAHSTEFYPETPHPVVGLITEWMKGNGEIERRSKYFEMGGTMRLGGQNCFLEAGTLTQSLYGQDVIRERHRHRYEFNTRYTNILKQSGLVLAGLSEDGKLVEVIENLNHPWFIGCQFHPEFKSTPRDGHPLFSGFVNAARQHATMLD